MGEKQDALMHELTLAVQALTGEVRALNDMLRPVAEAIAEKGVEGDVARAVMGDTGRWKIRASEMSDLRTALEGAGFRSGGAGMFRVVKIIRSVTGLGLKEAKDLYDREGRSLIDRFEVR